MTLRPALALGILALLPACSMPHPGQGPRSQSGPLAVVATNPADGTSAPTTARVELAFNRPVSRAAGEAALSLFPGDYNPAGNPAAPTRLNLTSMCDGHWRVRNPNPAPVAFRWDVYGSAEAGVGVVRASSDAFFRTSKGPRTVRLFVGSAQQSVKASNLAACAVTDGFSWSEDATRLTVRPAAALQPGPYTAVVSTALATPEGERLATPHVFRFTVVAAPPAVTAVDPPNAAQAPASTAIAAAFSAAMQGASGAEFVITAPATPSPGGVRAGSYAGAGTPTLSFQPEQAFRAGELVEVTLTRGLRSLDGQALARPYVFRFRAASGVSSPGIPNQAAIYPLPDNAGSYIDTPILADVSGDGAVDLVVNRSMGGYLAVFVGDGAGGLALRGTVEAPGALDLASGDFDRDGKLDLLTVQGNAQTIALYRGLGGGTFAAPAYFPTGSSLRSSLQVGDLDGDGDLDAVALGFSYSSTHLGNGDGSFAPAQVFRPPSGEVQWYVREGELADADNDGRLDLVLSVRSDSGAYYAVKAALGNGDGTFDFSTPDAVYEYNHQEPYAIATGDLDHDGRVDAVVTESTNQHLTGVPSGIRVFLGRPGNGFAEAPQLILDNATPSDVVLADFNGDGRLDLLTNSLHFSTHALAFGNGDGTFARPVSLGVTGYNGRRFVAGDVDGDGKLDVAIARSYYPDALVLRQP